ncbi:hypothetical protein PUN28_001823 [Cardiocondyla obscurior]|uniref:Uncharacterized protein n=1 Tax=Cardiocondyla obscurior TaxID=286306 RepID=A0AAW2GRF5_9HYME
MRVAGITIFTSNERPVYASRIYTIGDLDKLEASTPETPISLICPDRRDRETSATFYNATIAGDCISQYCCTVISSHVLSLHLAFCRQLFYRRNYIYSHIAINKSK